jgi:hypothetical protein
MVAISIAAIQIGERRRKLDQAKVDALARSIAILGLKHPVTVYQSASGFDLIAGWHRIEAVKRLGLDSIEATVITENTALWEIDENLARAELTSAEIDEHLAARKEIWEIRQAEARNRVESAGKHNGGNTGASCASIRHRGQPKGFAAETAGAVGLSKSQINRRLARTKQPEPRKLKINYTVKTIKHKPVVIRTLEQITIEPGIGPAHNHYLAELAKLRQSERAAEIERLNEEAKPLLG